MSKESKTISRWKHQQANRQASRQVGRQAGRQASKQAGRQAGRQASIASIAKISQIIFPKTNSLAIRKSNCRQRILRVIPSKIECILQSTLRWLIANEYTCSPYVGISPTKPHHQHHFCLEKCYLSLLFPGHWCRNLQIPRY